MHSSAEDVLVKGYPYFQVILLPKKRRWPAAYCLVNNEFYPQSPQFSSDLYPLCWNYYNNLIRIEREWHKYSKHVHRGIGQNICLRLYWNYMITLMSLFSESCCIHSFLPPSIVLRTRMTQFNIHYWENFGPTFFHFASC